MSLESATWATQLDSSNPLSTDPRSQGDDHLRLTKSVLKTELSANNRQWVYTGHSANWGSSTSLIIDGDQTGVYEAGRRVKVVGSSTGTIYGAVASSTYSAQTSINLSFDSGNMTNEAITPYVGALSYTNRSDPEFYPKYTTIVAPVQIVYASADESVTSSTTVQDDDELTFTTVANKWYALEGCLLFSAAADAPGVRLKFNAGANFGSVSGVHFIFTDNTGEVGKGDQAYLGAFSEITFTSLDDSDGYVVAVKGAFKMPSGQTTFTLQWAQASSSGTSLTRRTGSWLRLTQLD